jgi:hypothetical protein
LLDFLPETATRMTAQGDEETVRGVTWRSVTSSWCERIAADGAIVAGAS